MYHLPTLSLLVHTVWKMGVWAILLMMPVVAQNNKIQIQLQESLYQENVVGNLEKAIAGYEAILAQPELATDLQARLKLQLAFCYEKIGNSQQACLLYAQIAANYPQMPALTRWANIRLGEHERRQQIAALKEQLSQLQATSKEQWENQIKKLQERIRELERQSTDNPAFTKPLDTSLEQTNPSGDATASKPPDTTTTKPTIGDGSTNKPPDTTTNKPTTSDGTASKPLDTTTNKPTASDGTASKPLDTTTNKPTASDGSTSPTSDNKNVANLLVNPTPELLTETFVKSTSSSNLQDVLSQRLYHVGQYLYQNGLLLEAKENLLKSLNFNPNNEKSKDLLKKVDMILASRDMAPNSKTEAIQKDFGDDKRPAELPVLLSSLPKPNELNVHFLTKIYDSQELFKQWKVTDVNETTYHALLKLCQGLVDAENWASPAMIQVQDGKIIIYQTDTIQEKFTQNWNTLATQSYITVAKTTLFIESNELLSLHRWVFTPTNSGMFYTILSPAEKQNLWQPLQNTPILHQSPEHYLLQENKMICKYLQQLALIQGMQDKNLLFQVYTQGIQVSSQVTQTATPKIQMQVNSRKIGNSIPIIYTLKGPSQSAYWGNQQERFEFPLSDQINILIGGISMPQESKEQPEHTCFLLVELQRYTMEEFFKRKVEGDTPPSAWETMPTIVRTYNISNLQKIIDYPDDMVAGENRSAFLLRWLGNALPSTASLKIFQDSLVVTGPMPIQQQIEKKIEELQAQQQVLIQATVHLLACPDNLWDDLLARCKIQKSDTSALQWYQIAASQYPPMNFLKDFPQLKLEYSLPPLWLGNTQWGVAKNCQTQTVVERIEYNDNRFWQTKITHIPIGLAAGIRPVITKNQSELEIAVALYESVGERNQIHTLPNNDKLVTKIGEQNIERLALTIPYQKGQFYLVTGFNTSNNTADSRRRFLLVLIEQK